MRNKAHDDRWPYLNDSHAIKFLLYLTRKSGIVLLTRCLQKIWEMTTLHVIWCGVRILGACAVLRLDSERTKRAKELTS